MWKHLFGVLLSSLILFNLGAVDTHDQIEAGSLDAHTHHSAPTGADRLLTSNSSSWTTGGPSGGQVNSLAIAGTNPDIIYAGTESGVFKTTDGGESWAKTGMPEMLVRVVQVAPDNPDIVYAGTDDGIYKSEDGGGSWIQKGLSGARVNAIVIDPNNSSILYAGTGAPEVIYSSEIVGIFKSMDAGKTWQEKLSDPDEWALDAVVALLIDVDNSSYIYAGVFGSDGGFRKSTDGGENWVSKKIGPFTGGGADIVALAMTPIGSDPRVVYVIGASDDVHKSTDRGETWQSTGTPWISPNSPWALAVDPNNPSIVYVGTHYSQGHFYKSSDGGNNWSVKVNGLPQEAPASIVIDRRDSAVYVGLESGVYKSKNGAASWSNSSQGIDETYIRGLAVDPTSSDTVFAAVKGLGLARTNSGGASWDYLAGAPTDLTAVAIDPHNPSTVYVGKHRYFTSHYIYRSVNSGQDWTSIKFLYCSGGCAVTVTDILIGANDPANILVAASNYGGVLARTTDGGVSWDQLGFKTTALVADPNDPGIVYAGKANLGYVNRYTDVWGNWKGSDITPSGGIGDVRDIEVDLDSRVYVAADDGLWRWDGSGWTTMTGLPTNDITALAIDRSSSPGIVYVGTGENGVFVSQDGGSTWLPFNEGLGNLSITKLAISANQPITLYAGTAFGGVWKYALAPTFQELYLPLTLKNY